MRKLSSILIFIALFHAGAFAQTPRLLADLAPGPNGSYPSNFTYHAGLTFFSAYTVATGTELWIWNGTNVLLATNTNATTTTDSFGNVIGNSSVPDGFTIYNGGLYYSAFEPTNGGELWRYQDSRAILAANINPDLNGVFRNSWPNNLVVFNNALYFSANGGGLVEDYELWKYDGATASRAANIRQSIASNNSSSYPSGLTVFNGALYFMADDGVNGYELWRHDGVNTIMLTNINPGVASSYPKLFVEFDGFLYFQALNDAVGFELWRTDGTNVSLAADIYAGGASSIPESFIAYSGSLYFSAYGTTGSELWKFDGTNAVLAAQINPAGDAFPQNLTIFHTNLVFSATDGSNGYELWSFNGNSALLVTNLSPTSDSFPKQFVVIGNTLFFVATNPGTGYEIWKYDGVQVTPATDISPGPANSYPQHLTAIGSTLFFSATDDGGQTNWEPWMIEIPSVFERPRFTSVVDEGDRVKMHALVTPNVPLIIETSTNLVEWDSAMEVRPTETNFWIADFPTNETHRFFRFRVRQ